MSRSREWLREALGKGTELRGLDKTRVVIALLGREFPAIKPGPDRYDDGNWLNVAVAVDRLRDSWHRTAPCLLISEVARAADWLEKIAQGAVVEDELCFLEPNLEFALRWRSENSATIRIYFEVELRPHWAATVVAGQRDLWVDLEITFADLKAAAQSLRNQLAEVLSR